ncbi:MAG: hypothetical protein JWM33_751 [Caulobacteraceae bacterium]|nr:hypothetical protein [Caulobacteraceae bacterium]
MSVLRSFLLSKNGASAVAETGVEKCDECKIKPPV